MYMQSVSFCAIELWKNQERGGHELKIGSSPSGYMCIGPQQVFQKKMEKLLDPRRGPPFV